MPVCQFFDADSNINVVIHGAEITIRPKQAIDDGKNSCEFASIEAFFIIALIQEHAWFCC